MRVDDEDGVNAVTSIDRLLVRASDAAGSNDFGPDSFTTGLEILLRSFDEQGPSPALRSEFEAACVRALTNRLRVVDHVAKHPDVARQPISSPLIIMGMPRSGTTLASCLLDQDPRRRSLLLWEAWDSVPPPSFDTIRTDRRCLDLLAVQRRDLAADPGRVRPHVEWADGPTECIRLHAQDFKSLYWESFCPVPEYSWWIMEADLTSAYEYERMVLQVLQSTAPGPWSLKMPSHSLHIAWLLRVFPDARLVWIHRHPHRSVASLFSMKSRRWTATTGDGHVGWLREHYVGQLAAHVNRPLVVRDTIGTARLYDLQYTDLVGDPIDSMRQLYAWAGDELTDETTARMERWLASNPQGLHGDHRYTLEQFGLNEREIDPHFADYMSAIPVAPER